MRTYLAVDIGASGGRHILGHVKDGVLVTEEVYRFENNYLRQGKRLVWDVDRLAEEVLRGMETLKAAPPRSVGIDTWGVDCVLLDRKGQRVGNVYAYRDSRTAGMDSILEKTLPFDELYRRTGTAKQPFNTVYQLMATPREDLQAADRCLFLPEYLAFRLCGEAKSEYTIASTSALLHAENRDWDRDVMAAAGIPDRLFPEKPLLPGARIGSLTRAVRERVGYSCEVVFPASHDTGSAFMAVPAKDSDAVYLSSGTWSLLGVEREDPITSSKALASGFTNEGGYGGRIRLLKNIMGMWMVQSIRRELGKAHSYDEMSDMVTAASASGRPYPGRFDVSDQRFLAPPSMSEEIRSALEDAGYPPPASLDELLLSVYESLIAGYRDSIATLEALTGSRFRSLNIVGGGSRDVVLNQMTANAVRLPVYAGPAEGTALGNLIAQMISDREIADLPEARRMLRKGAGVSTFLPQGS